jgi:hypothetical protein
MSQRLCDDGDELREEPFVKLSFSPQTLNVVVATLCKINTACGVAMKRKRDRRSERLARESCAAQKKWKRAMLEPTLRKIMCDSVDEVEL